MRKLNLGVIILFLFICFTSNVKSQTLIMNEVSNGPSGNQEYVEFVVVSNTVIYNCASPTPPCIDIRGWIFDDNSGYHGTSGVAAGAIRFSNNAMWACIPLGTIILIYNGNPGERNPAIPSDDLTMADGNCKIIAPVNNVSLFDVNVTTPGAVACSYPATGWTAGGNWNNTAFANSSDCARIVDLAGCEVFSVCYGASDNLNNLIYFAASGTNKVYYFNGINPTIQSNWTEGSAATTPGNQTPGAPNNAANAGYINQFNNGCTPITPVVVTATSVNTGCTCNGSATANATGSIAGYTYAWYDSGFIPIGQSAATATGLCSGIYNVIATSYIGCSDTTSVTITSSSTTSVTVNSQTICLGGSTLLTATPSSVGGTYAWTPGGQSTQTVSISPTSTTNYSVTYTLGGCIGTGTAIVTVNPLPTITVNSSTICAAQSATLTANGATSYAWNTGSTLNPLIVSPASTTNYTITGTTGGCTNTAIATVSVNPLPIVTVNSPTICVGQSATLTANGATTFTWNTGSILNPLTVSPVSTTNYMVTGTTAGCTNTAIATVSVNPLPIVTVNSPTICSGQSGTLTANGATTYTWNTGSALNPLTISPASTTDYTVTGTTAGCTNTAVATVSVNPLPTVTVNSPTICVGQSATLTANGSSTYTWNTGSALNPLTVSPVSTTNYTVTGTTAGCTNTAVATVSVNPLPIVTVNSPTICTGQSATLTANGSTTYTWNTGSTTNPLTISPATTTNYTVSGTTAGCTNTAVATVSVNPLPIVTVNSPTICVGQSATLTANGSATYTWNTGSTLNPLTVTPASTTNYTVTGTTAGCTNTANATVSVNPLPIVTVNSPTICIGQSATLTANGATTYTWNSGSALNPLTVSPASTTNYTITGETAGCISIAIATVSVNPLPIVTANSSTICTGLTATLTANGATTYTWNTGATTIAISDNPTTTTSYSVTGSVLGCNNTATATIVISSFLSLIVNTPTICTGQTATLTVNGANTYTWSNGVNGSSILVSPANTTTYSVIGTNGTCTGSTSATVNVNSLPTVIVNSSTICAGQSATLTANGATTYAWNTGSTINPLTVSPTTTTNYTVTAANAGCTNTAIATVSVNPLPIVTVNSTTICTGQSATLTANGSTTYTWNTGATSNPLIISPATTTNYTVTGITAGCTNTAIGTVTVISLPIVTVNSSSICAGQSATLTANGATTYTWNTGATSNPLIISPALTTDYTVTGLSSGCTNTTIATVSVNPLPSVTVNSPTICMGQSATLTANGATTYTWNTGATSNPLTVSPTSTTYFTVTGTAAGCTNTVSSSVSVVSSPTLITNPVTICAGQTTTLTVSGATSYSWSNGSTTNTLVVSPTSNTTYSVSGSMGGCSSISSVIVTVNQLPIISAANKTICVGQSATLTANGAATYTWNTGSSSNPLIVNPSSSIIYTVTGANLGCSASAVVSVIVNSSPNIIFNSNVTSGCAPLCVQFSDLSIVQSSTINSWSWAFDDGLTSNQQNPQHCFDSAGLYDVSLTVTSSNGCSKTITNNNMINVFQVPTAEFTSDFQITDILNPTVQFINQSSNATLYNWSFGDLKFSDLTNPSHTYNEEGNYNILLTATNAQGCKDVAVHEIIINGIFTFYAPNTFSPNEDNINDVFLPLGVGWNPDTYVLNIFDRWGNNCFISKDIDKGWDGKSNNGAEISQIDTYTWKVTLSDVFGKKHKYIGRITILK